MGFEEHQHVRMWWLRKEMGVIPKSKVDSLESPTTETQSDTERGATANWQPIPGDMPVDEGLKFGGIRYHGQDFLACKVALMCNPKNDRTTPGLSLGHIKTWDDLTKVAEEHQGHCWIADRIDDYRGVRGPVWRRIAASDGMWLLFKRAEDRVHPSSFRLHPSFLMVKAVIGNSQREISIDAVVAGIVLAVELAGDTRNAKQDMRIIDVVCVVAEQNRLKGQDAPIADVIAGAKAILLNPKFERCFNAGQSNVNPQSAIPNPKSRND